MANRRIQQLDRAELQAAVRGSYSLRAVLRKLTLTQNSVNCRELRLRLVDLGIPTPIPVARTKAWCNDEALRQAVQNGSCFADVLNALGVHPEGGNYRTLKRHIARLGLDAAHLAGGRKRAAKKLTEHVLTAMKRPSCSIFVEQSTADRSTVKKRILAECLLPYRCAKCGNTGEWFGQALVLELEHKNGVRDDNRLVNLEFLCPNCHSQTLTFSGRNNRMRHQRAAP